MNLFLERKFHFMAHVNWAVSPGTVSPMNEITRFGPTMHQVSLITILLFIYLFSTKATNEYCDQFPYTFFPQSVLGNLKQITNLIKPF